jgi:hypothetical protein
MDVTNRNYKKIFNYFIFLDHVERTMTEMAKNGLEFPEESFHEIDA